MISEPDAPPGGAVAVTSVGAGTDVVFLSGMAVYRYLRTTRDLVARRARAHIVHLPGTGDAPDPPRPVGLPGDVAATVDWLEQNPEVGPVVLVGHSYGCQVAGRVAAALPDRVTALVLAGPSIDPAYRTWPRLLARFALESGATPAHLGLMQLSEQRRAGARRMLAIVRSMLADDPEKTLARVHVPMTVVRGEDDRLCTEQWARRLADRPGGSYVRVEGGMHAFPYDRPEALADAVKAHLPR
ncbi:alpha/beta hydrolase [Actinopolymorpha sp. NPDC004070]|uniref:alpha/beta fold hydrolase n=1 Tax=Actinopolymorpha sp. NPDC004070 TaxID=3154548 RepID=UPI0033B10B54